MCLISNILKDITVYPEQFQTGHTLLGKHTCFNPLSQFELCFPIDWRLLVDWDIFNSGQLENSFFFD